MRTIPELRDLHRQETRRLVERALEESGWSITQAARALRVRVSSLQSLIRTHGLSDVYAEHAPGVPGRPPGKKRTPPKKTLDSNYPVS